MALSLSSNMDSYRGREMRTPPLQNFPPLLNQRKYYNKVVLKQVGMATTWRN